MSALDNLKTLYTNKAAELTDDVDSAECLAAIDRWHYAATTLEKLLQKELSSYSAAQRSVTRASINDFQRQERELKAEIMSYLYRRGAFVVDHRESEDVLTHE